MKGNFKLKGSFLLMFFFFCCLKSTSGIAQCSSGISLKEVVKTTPGQENGSITVSIETSGTFECVLYRMTSVQDILIEKVEGQNNQMVTFKNLPPDDLYKAVVTFSSEKDLICKKRQLSDLSTIE